MACQRLSYRSYNFDSPVSFTQLKKKKKREMWVILRNLRSPNSFPEKRSLKVLWVTLWIIYVTMFYTRRDECYTRSEIPVRWWGGCWNTLQGKEFWQPPNFSERKSEVIENVKTRHGIRLWREIALQITQI